MCGWVGLLDELGGHAQRTCAARRVYGHCPPIAHEGMTCAEQEFLHGRGVLGRTGNAEVALAGLIAEDLFFGAFDDAEDRRVAVRVLKDTDGEVDLRGIRIALERLLQPQDGVRRRRFDSVEHGRCSLLLN